MSVMRVAVGVARLPFLTLTPVCVLLGVAMAWWVDRAFSGLTLLTTLVGALAAHVSVNAFNEYQDFRSGLDLQTRRTPFSGGSGTLPANPALQNVALLVALLSLVLVMLSGLVLLRQTGPALLPLGVAGIVLIYFYTGWINRHALLCLLAPGIGFGPLMMLGAYLVLTGHYSTPALALSLIPMFLVSNVLLLNQFPDIDADRAVGRRHLLIVAGESWSAKVWVMQFLAAHLLIVLLVALQYLPPLALMAVAPVLFGIRLVPGVLNTRGNDASFVPLMGLNVVVAHVTPLLLAAALYFSS